MRPPDECPYDKPFPAAFTTCQAYAPRTYIALDLQYRTLPPVWTCNHLKLRRGVTGGGFYAACSLGEAPARVAYAESLASDRVQFMRKTRAESVGFSTPLLQELWTLKGREMAATKRGDHGAMAVIATEMRVLHDRFNRAVDQHMEPFAEEGATLGIDIEAVAAMSKAYVTHMIASNSTINTWSIPADLLARFPDDVQDWLKAEGTSASA